MLVSSMQMFTTIEPDKLRLPQIRGFEPYFNCLEGPKYTLPMIETVPTMSYYTEDDSLLFRSYLPGYLRKRSTFREQLVMLHALIEVLHAIHDHAMSGGHLAY